MADEKAAEKAHEKGQQGAKDNENESGGEDQRIPYARFEEVNKRAKQAEQELQDLRSKIMEFEDRDKSEAERAKARAERAESQLSQLQNTVTGLQKGAWVRSAAAELGFHDPEDAVAHLSQQLSGLEDDRDAKRAVKALAQSKKHLVRSEKKEDRPRIGQMFAGQDTQNGQNGSQNGGPRQVSPAQAAAQRELEFAQGLSEQLNRFRSGWHEAGGAF